MDGESRTLERASALLDLGRAVEAERLLRDALASTPDSTELLVELGRALNQQDRYDDSVTVVRRALGRQPDHLDALMVLSASAAGQGDNATSLRAVTTARQLAPGLPAVHRQEGLVFLRLDQPAPALAALGKARRLDPDDARTVAAIGSAHYALRQFPEAEKAVADALQLDASNIEAHRLRGLLELRRGGGRDAVETHRTTLRLDPSDPDAREALAIAMKTRNPLYGFFLRYSDWMAGLPRGMHWLVILAPLLLGRVLSAFADELWEQILLVVLAVLILLSWALEPIMNSVLVASSYARNLLPRATVLATYAFLGYLAAALAVVVTAVVTGHGLFIMLAASLLVWSMSVGQVHLVAAGRRRLAIRLQYAGATLALASTVALALGVGWPVGVLLVTGIAMLWFTAFA